MKRNRMQTKMSVLVLALALLGIFILVPAQNLNAAVPAEASVVLDDDKIQDKNAKSKDMKDAKTELKKGDSKKMKATSGDCSSGDKDGKTMSKKEKKSECCSKKKDRE